MQRMLKRSEDKSRQANDRLLLLYVEGMNTRYVEYAHSYEIAQVADVRQSLRTQSTGYQLER